jgi:Rod binding domain-containing protein
MMSAISDSMLSKIGGHEGAASVGTQPESLAHKKLRKAAQDFEGILISQLWGDAQPGFSSLTGDAPLAGTDTLNSLAIQTLSADLAKCGGLGIGRMLVHQLEPSLPQGARNLGGGKIKKSSEG